MVTKNFLVLIPFFLFAGGYWLPHFFFNVRTLETPSLLGKNVQEALCILSQPQLNVRVIGQKEETTLEQGTILTQIPAPYHTIKPHQSVLITISKKPSHSIIPQCQGQSYEELKKLLTEKKIRFKSFFIESPYPNGYCIAQSPPSGTASSKDLILYIAHDSSSIVLFPDLEKYTVTEACDFLKIHSIVATIFHTQPVPENHLCTACTIVEQRPVSGSLVNLKKPLSVQLKVSF